MHGNPKDGAVKLKYLSMFCRQLLAIYLPSLIAMPSLVHTLLSVSVPIYLLLLEICLHSGQCVSNC